MNFTGLIPAFLICTIPVLAALACMVVLIKEFKLGFGFVAVFCDLCNSVFHGNFRVD